jgi:hypothetical protein
MNQRSILATGILALALAGCDSDNNRGSTPTTPPPPPAATIAGNWSGSETVTSARPEPLCVANAYEVSRLNQAKPVTATFTVSGTNITITYTTPIAVYTAAGTLSGQDFTATTTAASPVEHRVPCIKTGETSTVTRFASFAAQTITGTANTGFTSITGTVTTREHTRTPSGDNSDDVTTIATLALTK